MDMKVVLANGAEVEVAQVSENIMVNNLTEPPNKKTLDIIISENCDISLDELGDIFTAENCTTVDVVNRKGTTRYTGYIESINISDIIDPSRTIRTVKITKRK